MLQRCLTLALWTASQVLLSGTAESDRAAATARTAGQEAPLAADGGLGAAVDELVGTLAQRSPIGLRRMKRMIDDGLEQSLPAALRYELSLNALHAASHDRMEGLAAFAEKRKPAFEGH